VWDARGVGGVLTTPEPAYDVRALFPGIEDFARTATRLHPRPGAPDAGGSHVGGPLRWPAGEPWPACTRPHVVARTVPIPDPLLARLATVRGADPALRWPVYQEVLAELATRAPGFVGLDRPPRSALYQVARAEPVPTPLVPLAQLRAADVPDLAPPAGTDTLQVLWCPNDHEHGGGLAPEAVLRWRRLADLAGPADPPAPTAVGHPAYLPRPCVLHPERVVEYPWWQQLPVELGYRVMVWDAAHEGAYHRQLAAAPGWKVGGWPRWPTTDPVTPYCERCGDPMPQLLQIDSDEWGDGARWRTTDRQADTHEDGRPGGTAAAGAGREPTGVVAGQTGLYRIFSCRRCPGSASVDLQ
jgi:hypothetical protein